VRSRFFFTEGKMKYLIVAAVTVVLLACGCVTAEWEHNRRPVSVADRDISGSTSGEGFPYEIRGAGGLTPPASENWAGRLEKKFSEFPGELDGTGLTGDEEGRKVKLQGGLSPVEIRGAGGERQFETGGAGGEDAPVGPKRMIIYTGQYVLSVYDLEESAKKIVKLTRDAGGYVSKQTNEMVTVRVPADKFSEVVEALEKLGRVIHKEINAQDVTEQYTDLSLRLAAKKKYLETLQKLLEKAQDAKAMLEIQKEVGRVIEEIESMEGRLRYLADRVSYSTISVRLHLATRKAYGRFRLPFSWIEALGVEHLVVPGGGAR
jgi:hypothetical protein